MDQSSWPMGAQRIEAVAQPIPWFYFSKISAHGLSWVGLGRDELVLAHPIWSPIQFLF